jgi:hypothetical protein
MDENKAIDSAYLAAIENLFKVLSSSYLLAKGNADEEKKADLAFQQGLAFNQRVYQKAKSLLK